MRVVLLLMTLMPVSMYAQQINIDSSKQILVGLDISQLSYYLSPHKTGLNIGINGQYKLLKQLSVTGGFYFNDISNSRGRGYVYLSDYKSRGYCLKLGIQTGVKVYSTKKSRHSVVMGVGYGKVSFRESGLMVTRNKYWGDYYEPFNTIAKNASSFEYTIGYELVGLKRSFKVQYYNMLLSFNKNFVNNSIANRYSSVFVPGYGFFRFGLNCIYSFNIADQSGK